MANRPCFCALNAVLRPDTPVPSNLIKVMAGKREVTLHLHRDVNNLWAVSDR